MEGESGKERGCGGCLAPLASGVEVAGEDRCAEQMQASVVGEGVLRDIVNVTAENAGTLAAGVDAGCGDGVEEHDGVAGGTEAVEVEVTCEWSCHDGGCGG